MLKALTAPTLEEADLQKELSAVSKVQGKERADILNHLLTFIKDKEGEKEFKRLIDTLKDLGYSIPEIGQMSKTDWVDEKIIAIVGTAAGKIFSWTEKDFFEIGQHVISVSLLSKIYIQYFSSLQKTFEHFMETYHQYFSKGDIKLIKIDEKAKEAVVRIEGLNIHPSACVHFQGVIHKLIELATGSNNVKVTETLCAFFDKTPYHEYQVTW